MQADSNGDEVNLTGNVLGDAWSLATESGTLVLLRVLRGCAGRVPHLDEGPARRSLRCSDRVVASATVPPRSWTVHRGAGARTRVVRPQNPVAAAPYVRAGCARARV